MTEFNDLTRLDSNLLFAVGTTFSNILAPGIDDTGKSNHPIVVAFDLNNESKQPYMKELKDVLIDFKSFVKIERDDSSLLMVTDSPSVFIETDFTLSILDSFYFEYYVDPFNFTEVNFILQDD